MPSICWCASGFVCCSGLGILGYWLMDGVRASVVNLGYYFSWLVYAWIFSYVAPAFVGVAGVPALAPVAYTEFSSIFLYLAMAARMLR